MSSRTSSAHRLARASAWALTAVLAACGGGGGDDVPTPEWSGVTIEEPGDADTYSTDQPDIRLRGRSFVPPGSLCDALIGTIGPDYTVTVTNSANGDVDRADTSLGCLLQVNLMWESPPVPLAYGANRITVTAAVLNGRTGSDTITITRTADVSPPSVVSVVPSNGAVVFEPGSVQLKFNERVVFDAFALRRLATGEVVVERGAERLGTTETWLRIPYPLWRGEAYEVRAENVRDLGGNPLTGGSTFVSTFTTTP